MEFASHIKETEVFLKTSETNVLTYHSQLVLDMQTNMPRVEKHGVVSTSRE